MLCITSPNEKIENVKAYSLTNTAINSDVKHRWWEPDDIAAFWETLAAQKEPKILQHK